jgi:hypothetical protein
MGVDPGRRSPKSAADSSSWNAAARSSDSGAGNSNTNRLDREDDCYADLHPAITVTVGYFSACWPDDGEPVAVIRQRTRSDYPFPDRGQMLTWRLSWQHTAMLIDDQRGNCIFDITPVIGDEARQIAAGLAARDWPPDAARLPWVTSPYPEA